MANTAREKRWLVIAGDGRHVTLGRHSDPTAEELAEVEETLTRQGVSAWLAILEGVYYGQNPVHVLQVRHLTGSGDGWEAAKRNFLNRRAEANDL